MDPLSVTASAIAILQILGTSGQVLNTLLSLRKAPIQLQQLWNEAEALRGKLCHDLFQMRCSCCIRDELMWVVALLLETSHSLERRRQTQDYAHIEASITPTLETVRGHVLEFEQLIQ